MLKKLFKGMSEVDLEMQKELSRVNKSVMETNGTHTKRFKDYGQGDVSGRASQSKMSISQTKIKKNALLKMAFSKEL